MSEWNVIHKYFHTEHSMLTEPDEHMPYIIQLHIMSIRWAYYEQDRQTDRQRQRDREKDNYTDEQRHKEKKKTTATQTDWQPEIHVWNSTRLTITPVLTVVPIAVVQGQVA